MFCWLTESEVKRKSLENYLASMNSLYLMPTLIRGSDTPEHMCDIDFTKESHSPDVIFEHLKKICVTKAVDSSKFFEDDESIVLVEDTCLLVERDGVAQFPPELVKQFQYHLNNFAGCNAIAYSFVGGFDRKNNKILINGESVAGKIIHVNNPDIKSFGFDQHFAYKDYKHIRGESFFPILNKSKEWISDFEVLNTPWQSEWLKKNFK